MRKYLKKLLVTIIGASVMALSLGGCVIYDGHGWGHDWDGGAGRHGHDSGHHWQR